MAPGEQHALKDAVGARLNSHYAIFKDRDVKLWVLSKNGQGELQWTARWVDEEEIRVQLQWEKSATGQKAILAKRRTITGPVLGGIAYSKANDIAWVRAAFGGEWTGFEPYVRLWIKEGKVATGLTILMHNYPSDNESIPLPDVCIRWTEWREQPAVEGFSMADDKRLYVQDSLPLECVLRFYRSVEIGIDRLMERTSLLLAGGTPFVKVRRPEQDRQEIAVEFSDGFLFYQFSFFPGSFSSVPLEEAIQEWIEYARPLQLQPDYPPDEGFQVAYRESLWEQAAKYEGSFPLDRD